jgi:site-specific recombinase XerD
MQISKTTNHGNVRWRATASLLGKRRQRFFTSRDEARAWLNSIEADYTGFWLNRTPEEQRDIASAYNLASKRGVSIYQCMLNSPAKLTPLSITDTVGRYSEVIKRRSLRPSSLKQTQLHLSQLAREFHDKSCHEVTSGELEQWFHTRNWKRSTIDGVIAKIGPFFTWCVRESYCESNPCGAVKRPQSDDTAPAIFTPYQARKLLLTACESDAGMVPYLAIGLFAGVRPMEIGRLHRSDVRGHHIEITAAKAKTRKRRLVTLSDNLRQWLSLGGDYPPTNKPKRLQRILDESGVSWSPDIMRHSYASYHLALHQSADKTALEMGHRDTNMLFRHYRELVTKEAAIGYWNIGPKKVLNT